MRPMAQKGLMMMIMYVCMYVLRVIRFLNISSACSGYYCKSKFHQMSVIDRGLNKCRQGSWKNTLTFRVDKLKKSSGKL